MRFSFDESVRRLDGGKVLIGGSPITTMRLSGAGSDALDPTVNARACEQPARWFGSTTGEWEHLRTDVIPHGQPAQGPPLHPKQRVALGDGVFVCGDHRDTASIQGAMFSGERTASAVLHHLSAQPHHSLQPRLDGETSWR
jgi:hypothetical protein